MAKTYRLDLFVKPDSTATEQEAKDFAYNWANERTEEAANKDESGNYINAYYIDITDSRTAKKWMIFGDLAQQEMSLPKELDLLDATKYAPASTVDQVNQNTQNIQTLQEQSSEVEATVV